MQQSAFYRRNNLLRAHTASFYAIRAPALPRDNTKDYEDVAIVLLKANVKSEIVSGWVSTLFLPVKITCRPVFGIEGG
ncbi:hypothetical protein PQR57_07140 [Paraburkholderia dipogonis]|uniref:Uncharacterized protein n=1 Tax=Paraburkholderia dipogonis TaxID=1211383 RepID=A0ABW9ALQ7_9BURK